MDFLNILLASFIAHQSLQFPPKHEACCRGPMRPVPLPPVTASSPDPAPPAPAAQRQRLEIRARSKPAHPGDRLLHCSLGTGERNRARRQVFKQTLAALQRALPTPPGGGTAGGGERGAAPPRPRKARAPAGRGGEASRHPRWRAGPGKTKPACACTSF